MTGGWLMLAELQKLCRALLWVFPLWAACSSSDGPKHSGVPTPCTANDECPSEDECFDGTCLSQDVSPEGGASSLGGNSASGAPDTGQTAQSPGGMKPGPDGAGHGGAGDGLAGDGHAGDGHAGDGGAGAGHAGDGGAGAGGAGDDAAGGNANPASICTPNESFCQNQDVRTCSANGLTSTLDQTCTNQTCVETGGGAHCQGVCAPSEKRCASDGVQSCTNGQWSQGTICAAATPFCYSGTCNATAAPPSCTELPANCGASFDESCCTSPLVTGGTFLRSNEPSKPATISSFRLDKYEVTVGRFRKFVAAVVGGWAPAAGSGKHTHLNGGAGLSAGDGNELGWDTTWNTDLPTLQATWDGASNLGCDATYQTWTPTSGVHETKPINCVSWFQAAAFCIWDAAFLPSESEWNYAAAGGSDQRAYPWGEIAPGLNADLAVYGCYFKGGGTCTGVANIAPVGSVVAGNSLSYGHADLAGSVFEWTQDFSASYSPTCDDCASLQVTSTRSIRGGSFYDYAGVLRSWHRAAREPEKHNFNIGVRCARTP